MQLLKTSVIAFLLQLAVAVVANALTAPPPRVSVSVPMVIIHIQR